MSRENSELAENVLTVAHRDVETLRASLTIAQAIDTIRSRGLGEKIVYFYVTDDDDRLCGVLPARSLLTESPEKKLSDVMRTRVATVPASATVLEACEFFAMHRFLSAPVVDEERRLAGVVDVSVFTEQVFDLAERARMDEVFDSLGFRASQVRDASAFRAFTFRFPWLLATIVSGTACALLASAFELTLAKSLVLTFFMTLVLGLGESVSVQSMTIALQSLRVTKPTLAWYVRSLLRELGTALLLGVSAGGLVAGIVCVWRGPGMPALVVGLAVLGAICNACWIGLSVPTLLRALKLDPKIAAGPVTLAIADIATLLLFFGLGSLLL
ncbi:MAG: MgtE1: predicted magnesium transporter [Verrucomicrobiota bacterium]|jgi:magnesium transporter